MANPEWGSKRACLSCETKFYDFAREPIVCPKCETRFSAADFNKTKRSRPEARPPKAAAVPAPSEEVKKETAEDLDDEVKALDDEDGVKEKGLDEDENDLEGVITTDLDEDEDEDEKDDVRAVDDGDEADDGDGADDVEQALGDDDEAKL